MKEKIFEQESYFSSFIFNELIQKSQKSLKKNIFDLE